MDKEYYNVKVKEIPIEKPSFMDDLENREITFIDFKYNHYDIRIGGRIIEYTAIRVSKDSIKTFHVLAKPCTSLDKEKVKHPMSDMMAERKGYSQETLDKCRNTFEVFFDFYQFIAGSNMVIFSHIYHLRWMRYYIIECGLPFPIIPFYDIVPLVKKHHPELLEDFRCETNGFYSAYKCLLMYDSVESDKFSKGLKLTKFDDKGYYWKQKTENQKILLQRFMEDQEKYHKDIISLRRSGRYMNESYKTILKKRGIYCRRMWDWDGKRLPTPPQI